MFSRPRPAINGQKRVEPGVGNYHSECHGENDSLGVQAWCSLVRTLSQHVPVPQSLGYCDQ
jgi:hypothetical protein